MKQFLRQQERRLRKMQQEAEDCIGSKQRSFRSGIDVEDRCGLVQTVRDTSMAGLEAHSVSNQLREIEDALQAVARGTYGVCLDCDEPIPKQRLEARPQALRCRRCTEALEGSALPLSFTANEPPSVPGGLN